MRVVLQDGARHRWPRPDVWRRVVLKTIDDDHEAAGAAAHPGQPDAPTPQAFDAYGEHTRHVMTMALMHLSCVPCVLCAGGTNLIACTTQPPHNPLPPAPAPARTPCACVRSWAGAQESLVAYPWG